MKSRWQPSRFHGRSSSRPPQPNPPRATRYHPSMTGRRRRVTRRPGRPGRRRSTGSTPPPGMGRRHFRASSLTSSTARNPTARASRPGSSCRRASSSARAWSCPEDIDGAVGRVLREALAQPAAGAPRRPDAIRVADSVIAAEVRAAVQGAIPVTVAPTPELDDLRAQLIESMPPGDEDESYFAGGRVSPAAVERLFTAARALFAMKPWSLVADTRLLRMDIPALNVDGASLVVTGPTSGRRGVFIFPTPEGFDTFLDVAMQQSSDIDSGPTDVAAGYLALVYERVTDLPPSMRREAMTHGWRVDSADAYPVVECRDPDRALRPVVERDVEIVTACALSLGAFVLKHAPIFSSDTFTPVCESYFDDDDLEVRFTVPYDALSDFDVTEPVDRDADADFDVALDSEPPPAESFRPRVARNAPCPCGSGRKYKNCCLPADEAEHANRRHPGDTRLGRTTGEPPHALRDRGIGRRVGRLRRQLPQPAPSRLACGPLVSLRLRGGRPDGRRGLSRPPRPPLHAGGARLAERATRRLALRLGSAGGGSGQDGDAPRSPVRRAANSAGKARIVDPGLAMRCSAAWSTTTGPRSSAACIRACCPLAARPSSCGSPGNDSVARRPCRSTASRNAAFGRYLIRCWEETVDAGDT